MIGSALGGSVTVTIQEVDVVVATEAGWNSAEVAAAIAFAVNTDPTLTALGVSASSEGSTLQVDARISAAVSADAGISLGGVPVPGLAWSGLVLLAVALLWGARSR